LEVGAAAEAPWIFEQMPGRSKAFLNRSAASKHRIAQQAENGRPPPYFYTRQQAAASPQAGLSSFARASTVTAGGRAAGAHRNAAAGTALGAAG